MRASPRIRSPEGAPHEPAAGSRDSEVDGRPRGEVEVLDPLVAGYVPELGERTRVVELPEQHPPVQPERQPGHREPLDATAQLTGETRAEIEAHVRAEVGCLLIGDADRGTGAREQVRLEVPVRARAGQ